MVFYQPMQMCMPCMPAAAPASPPQPQTNIDLTTFELDVCRPFLEGQCLLTDCRLAHPYASNLLGLDRNRLQVCRNHVNGLCQQPECPYYHLPPHLAMELSAALYGTS